jgi:alpha-amylase
LGEFDQKWSRSTKWGSWEELGDLSNAAREVGRAGKGEGESGIEVVWDAVLSHKTAGDAVEEVWAVEVDPNGEFFVSSCFLFGNLIFLEHFRFETSDEKGIHRSPHRNLLRQTHQGLAEI